jgi:hypothetical protein
VTASFPFSAKLSVEPPATIRCDEPGLRRLVAGLCNAAAGVVVRQDHGSRVVAQGFLYDFARMDRCAVDGAAEQVLAGDQSVAGVEVDEREDSRIRAVPSGRSGKSAVAFGELSTVPLRIRIDSAWRAPAIISSRVAVRKPVGLLASVV